MFDLHMRIISMTIGNGVVSYPDCAKKRKKEREKRKKEKKSQGVISYLVS